MPIDAAKYGCVPLFIEEIPEKVVDLFEGDNNYVRYMYSKSASLWCRVEPDGNLYDVVNGGWTGWRDGDYFIIPGGNDIRSLEDCLHGFHHPRLHVITDWVEETRCSSEYYRGH